MDTMAKPVGDAHISPILLIAESFQESGIAKGLDVG
jgi:hypothetical protein